MKLTPRFIVNYSVNFSCKYLENFFWDNYIDCKSNSLRDMLEWFFLNRRYRFLKTFSDNVRVRVYKMKRGKYLLSVERFSKDYPESPDKSLVISTKSEKEVIHVCESFISNVTSFDVS